MKRKVVYGPPGTGKSTWLINDMKSLIAAGQDPDRIGFVSFTKAAAHELAHRVGIRPGSNISTIHSYAFRLLGLTRESVVDAVKLKEFSKKVGVDITGFGSQDGTEYPSVGDFYLSLYAFHRANLADDLRLTYSKSSCEGTPAEFVYFVESYDKWRRSHGFCDFEDMVQDAMNVLTPDLDILYVDEAQDLSRSQWRLVNYWASKIETVVVAGDADQAVHEWAGAWAKGMPSFEADWSAERIVLGQSYRIPKTVWDLATRLVYKCRERVDYTYNPREEEGAVTWHRDLSRVKMEHGEDTLVLFRNHSLRKDIEESLLYRRIPYMCAGGMPAPLQGKFAKCIRILAKARENMEHMGNPMLESGEVRLLESNANLSFKTKIRRGDFDEAVAVHWKKVIAMPMSVMMYLEFIEKQHGSINVEPTIRLMTIHASKGREADKVILLNDMTEKTADSRTTNPDAEIRVFYVGVTRAKKQLDIINGDNPLPELR